MGRLQRKKIIPKKRKKNQLSDAEVKEKKYHPLASLKTSGESQKLKEDKASKQMAFVTKSIEFLREVRVEIKKVTWPSRKQSMGSTLVVIVLVAIVAGFLGIVDISLSGLVSLALH